MSGVGGRRGGRRSDDRISASQGGTDGTDGGGVSDASVVGAPTLSTTAGWSEAARQREMEQQRARAWLLAGDDEGHSDEDASDAFLRELEARLL